MYRVEDVGEQAPSDESAAGCQPEPPGEQRRLTMSKEARDKEYAFEVCQDSVIVTIRLQDIALNRAVTFLTITFSLLLYDIV